ncbi:hypothetical protein GKKCFE_15275 [Pseudomonas sp. E141]
MVLFWAMGSSVRRWELGGSGFIRFRFLPFGKLRGFTRFHELEQEILGGEYGCEGLSALNIINDQLASLLF